MLVPILQSIPPYLLELPLMESIIGIFSNKHIIEDMTKQQLQVEDEEDITLECEVITIEITRHYTNEEFTKPVPGLLTYLCEAHDRFCNHKENQSQGSLKRKSLASTKSLIASFEKQIAACKNQDSIRGQAEKRR